MQTHFEENALTMFAR